MSVDLKRTDRWVSSEAGAGFQRFNDTDLNVSWAPVPLITLSSYARYQERDTSEWSARNTATWSPMPGGAVELHISGRHFYDSRTDTSRMGGVLSALWKPKAGFRVEGSVEAQRFDVAGDETTPVSTNIHGVWSF
jgi:hypothetical protein